MNTIKSLYDFSRGEAWSIQQEITLPAGTLAALVAYAESTGLKAGHDQHSKLMTKCREKAKALRYRHMAEAILPDSDFLYDPLYSEADEFADWETNLKEVAQ